jgi:hypothetical protein
MKKLIAIAILLLVAAGCGSGSSQNESVAESPESAPTAAQWEQKPPGEQNVSTMEPGEEFDAEPNFYYLEGCGHSCDAGVYPSPNPESGTPSITEKFPLEASADRPADRVQVVCQELNGKRVQNDSGAFSLVWNKVKIPIEHLTVDALADLPKDHGGFGYGWVPDIWTGNTGDHELLPC